MTTTPHSVMDMAAALGWPTPRRLALNASGEVGLTLRQGDAERQCGGCHHFATDRMSLRSLARGKNVLGVCRLHNTHCTSDKVCGYHTHGSPHAL